IDQKTCPVPKSASSAPMTSSVLLAAELRFEAEVVPCRGRRRHPARVVRPTEDESRRRGPSQHPGRMVTPGGRRPGFVVVAREVYSRRIERVDGCVRAFGSPSGETRGYASRSPAWWSRTEGQTGR